jgi:hypothetical protein
VGGAREDGRTPRGHSALNELTEAVERSFDHYDDPRSMLVDGLAHPKPEGATESTVLGPFWTEDPPERAYGDAIFDSAVGEPDAAFAVKPSLLRQFVRDGERWSVQNDIVLVRA